MCNLSRKIDFAVLVAVKKANPNGDPLNGNRPREDFDGYGEISDVCIKRKIRNRLQDMGERIFVQSDDRCDDTFRSLSERVKKNEELQNAEKKRDRDLFAGIACKTWIDVRSFGQVFAFKKEVGKGISVGVRGPVSIHTAVSQSPIDIQSMQITKSVNSETKETRSSDTMGTKHRVEFGLYLIKGSINHQLAQKTGFSDHDADKIKKALCTMFENDVSSARPDGSMEVKQVYWWEHNCPMGQYSSAQVHRTLEIQLRPECEIPKCFEDYMIMVNNLQGLEPEIYEVK